MKKSIGALVIVATFAVAMPMPTSAQSSESPALNLPVLIRSRSGGSRQFNRVVQVTPPGQVLGAFTSSEQQAKIDNIKGQLTSLMTQLLGLLKAQLAAATASGSR